MAAKTGGMLSPYRVLDLAGETGLLCGKILGDMGADVIKIERPGGDPARSIGPFYHDEPDPEKSLFWFAMNTSKRGITLNIETADGQEIFKKLVKNADFVIETFAPGYLEKLGLDYKALEKINPGVILVSITPFGQTGPYRDWKTADIVAWALGGHMAPYGDPDRPPIRFSHHSQAYLHAGSDAAMGAMMALYQRNIAGEGQQVDVSIFESAVQSTIHGNPTWGSGRPSPKRGEVRAGTVHKATLLWPCKDGYVSWSHGGPSRLNPSLPLVRWMESEGFTNDFMKSFNWSSPDFPKTSQEDMNIIEEVTGSFFMAHTKAELLAGAVKYEAMLYPVSTTADMLENPQLIARGFWVELEHPELGANITYAGAFGSSSEMPISITRRAPLIGEHNQEIYEKELGISKENLVMLKQAGVI